MDYRVVLSKILTLIYRSRLVGIYEHDDLIRTVLDKIKVETGQYVIGSQNPAIKLKEFCLEMLEYKEPISTESIQQRITLMLDSDPALHKAIVESIQPSSDDSGNKRTITSLAKLLNNYYKECSIIDMLSKASYDMKFNRAKISNFNNYIKDIMAQIEPLANSTTSLKDPAIVNEIDFENSENISSVFEEVKNINNSKAIFKTGFKGLNTMLQGGIRRGELVTIGALQHKYKTGFSLTLFTQIARLNEPFAVPTGKKPLLLRISFEDPITSNLQFMYIYLRSLEDKNFDPKELETISNSDLTKYIISKLTATGFHIKMLRVDPNQWTYLSVINKIIELEANGYDVQLLMLDYISLLPTTGCTTGPIGSDKKDLLRRIKNFCSSKNITVITPIQLSSEAKMLIRNGVPEHQFVNEISEKGYYDGTKSIDQDIDVELFIHLFPYKKKKYLSIRRGKHRIPTIIDDSDKYIMYRFSGITTPILEDVHLEEDTSFKVLPKADDTSSSILSEIF